MEEGEKSENDRKSNQLSMRAIHYELQSAGGNPNDKVYLRTADGALLEISGVGLSRPAAFNQGSGGYETFVKITSALPFFIKPVSSGPAAGTQALILQRTGHFRFLDLPIEIRHMIYDYLVADEDPIQLRVFAPRYSAIRKRVVEQSFRPSRISRPDRRPLHWNTATKKWSNRRRDAMNLLQVNREISREVHEALYTTNTFECEAATLVLLLKRNPKVARHMRRLKIHKNLCHIPLMRWGMRKSLALLSGFDGLQDVQFDHNLVEQAEYFGRHVFFRDQAVEFVERCVPMLNAVYRARKAKGLHTNMMEVLHLHHDSCSGLQETECLEISKQVKREIAQRFLIDWEDDDNGES